MHEFIMACIEAQDTDHNFLQYQKARIWLPIAFKKNSTHTHTKLVEAKPS